MERSRWLRYTPLAVIVAASATGIAGAGLAAAGDPAWAPRPCPATAGVPPRGDPASGSWFRMDPILGAEDTLSGQRLVLGTSAGSTHRLSLAPEAFASGPVAGLVLTGSDDGRISQLRLLDASRGCATGIAEEADVVRSAIMLPDGTAILEHRVDRSTRADLGVWRRSTVTGEAVRVLDPMPADDRFGPTYVTDLRLTEDGRIVAASCGERLCRTRVLDPTTGDVTRVDGTGPALGVHGKWLVAWEACAGMPCAVTARPLGGGAPRTLAAAAGAAALGGADGSLLVTEDVAGNVAGTDLDTGRTLPIAGGGLMPLPGGSLATSGVEAAPGSVVLAPGGRVRDGRSHRQVDPITHVLAETKELIP